ncbi:MAG: D-sedoheptulose-7-phosphate isomerase [bacterium]
MDDRIWIKRRLDQASNLFTKTSQQCGQSILDASRIVVSCLRGGGKILLCGNGGSAADAQHIAAEMTVKMKKVRSPLSAIALTTNSSLLTAQANDLGFGTVFSRQVSSLGRKGDVLIAISTSGNSPNIIEAVKVGSEMGLKTIGLTGFDGGRLAGLCDIAIVVPSEDVPRIQEVHIAIGHIICEYAEERIFGRKSMYKNGELG